MMWPATENIWDGVACMMCDGRATQRIHQEVNHYSNASEDPYTHVWWAMCPQCFEWTEYRSEWDFDIELLWQIRQPEYYTYWKKHGPPSMFFYEITYNCWDSYRSLGFLIHHEEQDIEVLKQEWLKLVDPKVTMLVEDTVADGFVDWLCFSKGFIRPELKQFYLATSGKDLSNQVREAQGLEPFTEDQYYDEENWDV